MKTMSKTILSLRVCALLLCGFAAGLVSVQAATVYDSGGFEAFVPTQPLDAQDPVNGPWAQDNGASTAEVTAVNPIEGMQSVKITRAAGAAGNTRWGVVKSVAPSDANNVVNIYFDMRVVREPNEFGPLFGIEAYDASLGAPKLIGSLLLDASMGQVLCRAANTGAFVGTGTYLDIIRHHHYQLAINFTEKTCSLYADGSLIHTEGFVDSTATQFTDAPLATLALDPANNNKGIAYFDNYRIEHTSKRFPYLVWQGDSIAGNWDVGVSSNWFDGLGMVAFTNGADVVFDDSGSAAPAIHLQGSLLPGAVAVSADLDYEFAGTGSIDGAAGIVKRGQGTLTLSNANGYSGDTEVFKGGISVRNTTGSATGTSKVSVFPQCKVSGDGTIGGSLWVASGGVVEPGVNGVGTLSISNQLVLDDSALKFDLGTSSDRLVAGGDLTVGGTLEIRDAGGFGPGTYTLITYGGALNAGSLRVTAAPEGYFYDINTGVSGEVQLVVTLPPPVPAAPSGLAATAISSSRIDLAWQDNSTNETSFLIERSENNMDFARIATTGADTTGYSDTGLTWGTTYYYRVRASNAGGLSAYSAVASATTQGNPPPAAPGGLQATALSRSYVALQWTDNSTNETGFVIQRAVNDVGFADVASVGADTTSFTDSGLAAGTTYYYRVAASNDAGSSPYSSMATVTTPATPLQLTWGGDGAANVWDVGVTANWSDGTNAVTFADGDTVLFNDAGSNNVPVTLVGTLRPASIVVNAAKDYAFSGSGAIAGMATLTKVGFGQLTISTMNSYSGGTFLNSGVLVLSGPAPGSVTANNFGLGAGPVTFRGGTLQLYGYGLQDNISTYGNMSNELNVPAGETGTLLTGPRYTLSSRLKGAGIFNLFVEYLRGEVVGDWSEFAGKINVFNITGTPPNSANDDFRVGNVAGWSAARVSLGTNVTMYNRAAANSVIPIGEFTAEPSASVSAAGGSGLGAQNPVTWRVGGLNTDATNAATFSGSTSLIKEGSGVWTLTGNSTHTGSTTVNDGTLLVNGSFGDSAVAVAGGTLGGIGTLGGSVTVDNAVLAPGVFSIGTLTVNNNVTLSGGSTTAIEITKSPNASDLLQVTGTLSNGGTLNVIKINSNALEAGDTFQLFDAGTSAGTFSSMNLPPLGEGLSWDTSLLYVSGTISVTGTNPPAPPIVIHPLGDSITWGYTTASAADSPGGYREPLYRNLTVMNDLTVHFVGANTSNPGPTMSQDGEVMHDGYPQYTITEVNNNLDGNFPTGKTRGNNGGYWITGTGSRPAIYPDIILLLIGSNDVEGGVQAATIEQRLDAMVTKIFNLRPSVRLYLASIPPYPADANKTAISKAYNQLIVSRTIPKHLAAGRNIRFVDQYANFIISSSPDGDVVNSALFGDTIHPNEAGYQLMGDTWAAAVLGDAAPLPGAPSALAASAVAADQINLTWTDNATNEGAFLIERSADNVTFTQVACVGADITSFADTGLSNANTYHYRIRARNSSGDSAYSDVASATTLETTPLAAPANLTATPGHAKVYLTWEVVSGATSYTVKRSTTDGGPYVTVAASTTTNYADANLDNGTTYYYVVTTVADGRESEPSVQASATPADVPVAHYQFELNTLDSSGNNNHGAPAGGLLYGDAKKGDYSAQFDGTSSFVTITRVVATNFTVAVWIRTTNTGTGSTWYNGMGIVDGEVVGGASDWGCSVLNSKFAVGIGAPDTTVFSTVNIDDGHWHHLAATRDSASGVVKLYVDGVLNSTATTPAGPRTAPNDLRIGATHAAVPVVLKGNLDDLRFYGEVLSAADIAKMAATPLTAPTNLVASSGDAEVYLTWDAVEGATSYKVKRATTQGGPYTIVANPTANNYTDAGLNRGTTYFYVVSAVNASGESADSAEASATTSPTRAVYSGRAIALKANILGVTNNWSDTGPLPPEGGARESSLLTLHGPDLFDADVAHASTIGQGDRTRSEASSANVALNIGGVTIDADFAMARATAIWLPEGTWAGGTAEIANLFIGGQLIVVSGQPNQTVPLLNGAVVINEQIKTSNSITVNALHIVINGVADVVVSSAQAGITAPTQPPCEGADYVSGGGWITAASGGRGNFAVEGGLTNGVYWGHLNFKDQDAGLQVKGTSVTAYQVTGTNSRHIEGTAQINGVDGYTYSVNVTDNGEPGANDTFSISLSNGYQAGGTLGGGNIQLHSPCQ
jgi:autotransporter-associated beta strand protein